MNIYSRHATLWEQTRQPVLRRTTLLSEKSFLCQMPQKSARSLLAPYTGLGNSDNHAYITVFAVSDAILLGDKHSKMCSKFMRKVTKSSTLNNFRVTEVLSIKRELQGTNTSQKVLLASFYKHRLAVRRAIAQMILIVPQIATRFNGKMLVETKTLIVAFLARRFPSNLIFKYFN